MQVPIQGLNGVKHDRTTACVVAIGSDAEVLSTTIRALACQTVAPHSVILAVRQSTDAAAASVKEALGQLGARAVVIPVGDAENFGDAIRRALSRYEAEFSATGAVVASIDTSTSWLWLLHADSPPEPEALEELLTKGEASAKIGIVGPKHVAPRADASQPYVITEIGIRATRTARRVPEMREGERDQGQYDSREDVLAVGSAGMLVRESVWNQLGGFNPYLGPFGDGLEFSRRVRLAGYRVVVASRALVQHAEQSLRTGTDIAASFGARRAAQIFNSLLAARGSLFVPLWLGYILAAIPRAIIRLVWRDYTRAVGELRAGLSTLGMFGEVIAGRRALAALPGDPASLAALEASASEVREAKKALRQADEDASNKQLERDPLEIKAERDLLMHTRRGFAATALLSLAFGIIIGIPYLAQGALTGGALATDSSTALDLARAGWHSWLATGMGTSGALDAYWLSWLPVLALGAPWGLTLGRAVSVALWLAPMLAAMAAYLATGRFTKSSVVRTIASLMWILAPSFLEALSSGRIAAATVHILLPLAVYAVIGVRYSRRGQLGVSALAFAGLAASTPIFMVGALLVALFGAIIGRGGRWRWLWIPLPAFLLLAPSTPHIGGGWRGVLAWLLSQPGVPAPSTTDPRRILVGFTSYDFQPLQPSLSWLLYIPLLIIVLAGVCALLRLRVAASVRIGWIFVILGMALAFVCMYVPIGVTSAQGKIAPVSAWHGIGFSIAWLGLFIAITAAANGLRAGLRRRSFGVIQVIGAALVALVPLALASIAGCWIYLEYTQTSRTLEAQPQMQIPAIATTDQASVSRSRVLTLIPVELGYEVEIWRGNGLQLHEYAMATNAERAATIYQLQSDGTINRNDDAAIQLDAADANLADTIANITAGSHDVAHLLSEHAISVVLVPPASSHTDTQARAQLIAYLNAAPRLEYVTDNEAGAFWRVPSQAAGIDTNSTVSTRENGLAVSPPRLRIVNPDNGTWIPVPSAEYEAEASIEAVDDSRYLVLAERADKQWTATLEGTKLTPVDSEHAVAAGLPYWAQIWELPAGSGGQLALTHGDLIHQSLLIIGAFAVLVSIVAILPVRSRDEDVA